MIRLALTLTRSRGAAAQAQYHFHSPVSLVPQLQTCVEKPSAHDVDCKFSVPATGTLTIAAIGCRYFHSTPMIYAQKKRRVNASSSRKKKQLQLVKLQKKKQQSKKQKGKQQQKSSIHHANNQYHQPLRTGIPDPVKKQHRSEQQNREIPQAFLVQTASPNAYIAKCAIMDEYTGEMYVDPKTLFSELMDSNRTGSDDSVSSKKKKQRPSAAIQLPQIFRNSHLEYFSPSSFPNHEPPNDGTPEVAFLGRSNTGKSSLINALSSLVQRGNHAAGSSGGGGARNNSSSGGGELARTSKRPGRTQTINYFGLAPNDSSNLSSSNYSSELTSSGGKQNVNESKLFLVDLPGFGYAAAPDESVDEWQRKTQEFLVARASKQQTEEEGASSSNIRPWPDHIQNKPNHNQLLQYGKHHANSSPPLKRLYLLIDSRLPNPALLDINVMNWCDEYCIPYTLVLTKVDGSSRAQCVKLTNQLCMRYHSLYMEAAANDTDENGDEEYESEVYMDPVIYLTSSKDGLGMEELLLSVENNMFSVGDVYDEDDDEDDIELDEDEGDDEIGVH